MELPFKVRQFIWCQFPYLEEPLRPGPKEHVAYIADIRQIAANAHLTVMSIYTTTRPWEPGVPLPLGILPVEPALAERMKQKSFVMDARKIAFIPADRVFFPRLAEPEHGIVHMASTRFHQLVQNTLLKLAGRPELVVKLGPDVPASSRRRSPRAEK